MGSRSRAGHTGGAGDGSRRPVAQRGPQQDPEHRPEGQGQFKEAAGAVTGNERLEAEGRADKTKASLKQAGEKLKDAFRGR